MAGPGEGGHPLREDGLLPLVLVFRLVEHPKQWARLFRGFTDASISPHRGHRNTNRPSRTLDGGPSRPNAAITAAMGTSFRSRRNNALSTMRRPRSVVHEVDVLLPVGLHQDPVHGLDVDRPGARPDGLDQAPDGQVPGLP